MKTKELSKSTITDLFEHMLESGESKTIIDAIRKERGNDNTVKSEAEQLNERKDILKKLKDKN